MASSASLATICDQFSIPSLKPFQRQALDSLLSLKDVYLSVMTGGGKSLCYQAFQPLWTLEKGDDKCNVLVVSPLISIMKEQCDFLSSFGFRSTYIGRDSSENEAIVSEEYQFLFASPEALLTQWRSFLANSKCFRLIVIDEAHTVMQW